MPSPSDPLVPRSSAPPRRRSLSTASRRSTLSRTGSTIAARGARLLRRLRALREHGLQWFLGLPPLQRAGVALLGLASAIAAVLSVVYHDALFRWLAGFAQGWRSLPMGWTLLWLLTFIVCFPPLIGYSTAIMLAGFVYGFPNGWFIAATASTIGAICAFLMCRYLFHDFVARIVAKNKRLGALALTLQHDGIRLLIMIRLCPLPFTLTNAALSSIPTVHWAQFAAATAIASPKLLLHVWIGAQLALLAEKGDKMDGRTKAVSFIGMAVGGIAGLTTGWWIYLQTVKRSKELRALEEAEEAEQGILHPDEFADDDDAELSDGTTEYLREEEDDISLRDDGWDEDYDEPYHDSSGENSASGSPPRPA